MSLPRQEYSSFFLEALLFGSVIGILGVRVVG